MEVGARSSGEAEGECHTYAGISLLPGIGLSTFPGSSHFTFATVL